MQGSVYLSGLRGSVGPLPNETPHQPEGSLSQGGHPHGRRALWEGCPYYSRWWERFHQHLRGRTLAGQPHLTCPCQATALKPRAHLSPPCHSPFCSISLNQPHCICPHKLLFLLSSSNSQSMRSLPNASSKRGAWGSRDSKTVAQPAGGGECEKTAQGRPCQVPVRVHAGCSSEKEGVPGG